MARNIGITHGRTMRMVGLICVTLLVAFVLTACGSDEGTVDKSGGTAAESTTPETITTTEDLQAAIDANFADESWYANITSAAIEQQLLTPVAVITIDLASDASGPAYDIAREIPVALSPLLEDSIPNIAILSGPSGLQMAGSGSGQSLEQTDLGLPSAPTNAEELEAWLDEVFAESGEAWYAHVTGAEYVERLSGYDVAGLIVHTDLTGSGSDAVNQQPTTLIRMAIAMSGQTFVEKVSVVNSSGENLSSGSLPPVVLMY